MCLFWQAGSQYELEPEAKHRLHKKLLAPLLLFIVWNGALINCLLAVGLQLRNPIFIPSQDTLHSRQILLG